MKGERSTWGFVDINGDMVIDYQFGKVTDFNNGVTSVSTFKAYSGSCGSRKSTYASGSINKQGNWASEPYNKSENDPENCAPFTFHLNATVRE